MHTTEENKPSNCRENLARHLVSIIAIVFPLCVSNSYAGTWDIFPSIVTSLGYTDNVRLDPPGEEQDDFILQLNPGIAATYQTPTTIFAVDYRMQNVFYKEISDADNTYHQLQAGGNVEFVRERAFVDASVTLDQNLLDPSERASSNLTPTESIDDVLTYSITPYYREGISDSVTGEIRYTFGEVKFIETDEKGTLNSVVGLLASDDSNTRFSWIASAKSRDIEYTTGEQVAVDRVEVELRQRIAPTLRMFGVVGYESTEINVEDAEEPDGPLYRIGVSWATSPRTTMELAVGENPFGPGGYGRIQSQTASTYLLAEYNQDITTVTEELLISPVFERIDSLGNPIERGELTAAGVTIPEVVVDPFYDQSFDLIFTVRAFAALTSVELYHTEREFLISREKERFYGGRLSWDWRFGARTNVELYTAYRWEDLLSGQQGDEIREWGLVGDKAITPRLIGTAGYRNFRNDSVLAEFQSEENVLFVQIRKDF
ncbi:MAG: TIGR03016 family PEP-CTERM system-associated outer membrane protein [Gammaproteobacteria bacterium]|nr:TIGR03016 family PEP-CTERM system-associated outer membrane protein [Gammaproteobacteria bacterium]